MDKTIIKKLRNIVGREWLHTEPEELHCYSYDGTGRQYLPEAVIFPQSSDEISAILQLANQHGFPVVPRGAGTGMTGGSLPVNGGLILVTSRMNHIISIDRENMIAVVEPGVVTGDLQKALKQYKLMYPPDPASYKFCSIGGNAAECAGGPSAVKYGVTKDYVIGLEVVLPTGEIMQTGVRTEKGVVGYDLTRLFIGSEGTLGVFTKLILRLLPLPECKSTFLLTFSSIVKATELVAAILSTGITPCTLEYMDKTAIHIVKQHMAVELPDGTEALLIVEIDGSVTEMAFQQKKLIHYLDTHEIIYQHTNDEKKRDGLWQARRSISPASFSLRPNKISEDVVVPRSRIPDLVTFCEQLSQEHNLHILTFGHAGDGNIHVNIMVDRNDSDEAARGMQAREKLFEFVIASGGSLSGEHGVGITKSGYISLEIDRIALDVMQKIKNLFDPNNILNPGKIFPVE